MRDRVEAWQQALRAVVDRHRAGPVTVGECDCASLVIEAVEAVTGRPVLNEFLAFSTPRGALRVLRNRGFAAAIDAIDANFTRIGVNALQRGDLGWGPALGDVPLAMPAVVDGAVALTMSHTGLIAIPRRELTTGWAV